MVSKQIPVISEDMRDPQKSQGGGLLRARSNSLQLSSKKVEIACAFGRFQPFHNGHLEHILGAKARCNKLFIGITNPDNTEISALSNETRTLHSNNPFSFEERRKMVDLVLQDRNFRPMKDFEIVPLPIEMPNRIPEYVPLGTTMYVSALDGNWSEEKIQTLQKHGWHVVKLPFTEKPNDATKVRGLMRDGDQEWRKLVPPVVAQYIDSHNLVQKLILKPPSN